MDRVKVDLVVVGAGPGGYTAAFYAAARGQKVVLIEKDDCLGGVCLNRGCIPSKALLHVAGLIQETKDAEAWGVEFAKPMIHLSRLGVWKKSVVDKLTKGLTSLAGRRNVTVIQGNAQFVSPEAIRVKDQEFSFQNAILATGSVPAVPKVFEIRDKRVMTSTEALAVEEVPAKLLVIGGGYIGMELGTVYAALGSQVVVAEALGSILAGADPDLVRLVQERASKIFREIRVHAKVIELKAADEGIRVVLEVAGERKEELYDRVLVAVGRSPVTAGLGLEQAKISLEERGFIKVDKNHRTTAAHIYAVGDVAGGVLLAHKASHDAKAAVDHMLDGDSPDLQSVPAVVFTDPEIAWCGLTEEEAKVKQITVQVVRFPWGASGRAIAMDRPDGVTKLLIDPKTEKILGVGICGVGAGELIGEAVMALRTGMTAKDLAHGIRPHPTLAETLTECAEMFYGLSTNAYSRKRA